MLRRAAGFGMLMFALLGVPRASDAGLIEFIWDMSGPQFIGFGGGCNFNLRGERQDCGIGSSSLTEEAHALKLPEDPPRLVLYVGGEYTFSTGKNSDHTDYEFFRYQRLAFTPQLTLRSMGILHHSAGVSYEFTFGSRGADFTPFDKFGFVIMPVDFVFKKWSIGPKVRIYPHKYTSDELGFGPRLEYNRATETTIGVTASLKLKFLGHE